MGYLETITETIASTTPRAANVCCAAMVKRLRVLGWSRECVDEIKLEAIRKIRSGYDDCTSHIASNCVRLIESGDEVTDSRLRDTVEAEVFAEFALLGVRVADSFGLVEQGGDHG